MFKDFFYALPANVLAIYRGRNWLWHVLAAVLTTVLVLSGADWWYYEHTRNDLLHPFVWMAGLGGFFIPVLLPVVVYVAGEFRKDRYMMIAGGAIAQAEVIALVLVAVYKTFTGRIQPDFIYSIGTTDISHAFQFGFLRNGVFWGWPSSHAAVACAGAAAFALMYRRSPIVALTMLYAFIVSFGASIGFHWLSDVIAGAIVGTLIGTVVARGARARMLE